MAILAFLAAAFLLLLPFRYVGNGEVYKLLGGLSFLGLLLILPATILAAALGARTYRSERRRGTRVGMGIGAIVGWTSFFALGWLTEVLRPAPGSHGFAFYAFVPLAFAAAGLVLYALATLLREGRGEMPAIGRNWSDEQLDHLFAYTRRVGGEQ